MGKSRKSERGAVALFVVILTALLVTTITVAFIRIMLQGQAQATANDLSKGALDSAYAGVEDVKRALIMYRKQCASGPGTSLQCQNWANLMDGTHCDALQQMGISGAPGDKEVFVKQSQGDIQLNQAYTCVKIQLDTGDFAGNLSPNTSRIIPLKGNSTFDRIVVEWYSQSDLSNVQNGGSSTVDLALDKSLPKLADWPANRPALLRLQLIQYGDSFNLSDFDKNDDVDTNNATLFLVPSLAGLTTVNFSDDVRQSHTSDAIQQIACDRNFSPTSTGGQFACKATIMMPNPIGEPNGNNRHAYLRVNEIYNPSTTFRVTLMNNTNPVTFGGVQPVADSTGRANDLFRRISARIELDGSSIPAIESAIDITGSLCKTFLVTDSATDYTAGNCTE